ncbi:transcription elongation factor subunit Spt4 [Methanofollis fontis]|uniref:Transcription elongation factor Spt4 n=1 Tax=Methanofollis fontis TaxID=2052832 RepID=A0A483CRA9_9EURY|nr:transcription elongation factor subunit Spt4 [Methanofollis fontis]TAJ45645.1 DNA-directed RNA polymerase subunit E'' [Methanofollis fontis]
MAPQRKKKKMPKVCHECHKVVEGEVCMSCGSSNLTEDWAGYLIIIDPKHSAIAERMNIDMPGRYALKVR